MTQGSDFIWYELMTGNTDAAAEFYAKVIGWRAADSGMPGMHYSIFSAGETMVAGLMAIPDEAAAAGMKPGWMTYIWVDDVDVYAERVAAAGGTVHRPGADIPGIGRFAVVADPDGVVFNLFRPSSDEGPARPAPGTPGLVGWHELHAGNGEAAFSFYSGLFGWTATHDMPMGELGVYRIFKTSDSGPDVGGMLTKMPQTPHPFWMFYFNVDALDAAMQRATDAGAQVIHGPMEVPGGAWIVQCVDPQGALFAMVAPKR